MENLKDVIDSHCIAGVKLSQILSANVPTLDVEQTPTKPTPCTPSVSSSMSSASSPTISGTPSSTGLTPIVFPDAAAKKTTPPSRAHRLVVDEGLSPLTANLSTIDEMFGGADIMSDEEEENDILVKHGQNDPELVYKSGHGRYKCFRVLCDLMDDPWTQVPHNCGYHPGYSLPDGFQPCGEDCRGAFCRCLKCYQT